jgi:hypothetical protein
MKDAEKAARMKAKQIATAKQKAIDDHAENAEMAEELFKDFDPGVGAGPVAYRSVMEPRDPEQAERAAAAMMARKLGDVISQGTARDDVPKRAPAKRLRSRGVIKHRVQEKQGRVPTAERFRGKQVTVTDEIPLKIGVMTDVSGSMNSLAEPLAVTTYMLSNAAVKVDAEFAAVAFGASVTPVAKRNRALRQVPHIDPRDPHERFDLALKALDGELDLMRDTESLRILILASDGAYGRKDTRAYADEMIPFLASRGVIVLHLDFEGGNVAGAYNVYWNARHNNPEMPLVIDPTAGALNIAVQLGNEIIKRAKAVRGQHSQGA